MTVTRNPIKEIQSKKSNQDRSKELRSIMMDNPNNPSVYMPQFRVYVIYDNLYDKIMQIFKLIIPSHPMY